MATHIKPLQRLRLRVRNGAIPTWVVRAGRARRSADVLSLQAAAKLGARPRVELYFAFDDPYSAVAVPGLMTLCERHRARLALLPVTERGIRDDPDANLRRAYAVLDANRLLQRGGQALARSTEVLPDDLRFLARWTEAARAHGGELRFARAAVEQLWLRDPEPPSHAAFAPLYEEAVGEPPPGAGDARGHDRALADNAARLRRRGHWETPSARIAGQWFFAHERLAAIEALLAQADDGARAQGQP